MSQFRLTVLLVEDDPSNVNLVQRCLKDLNGSLLLEVARNGDEAMVYLSSHVPDFVLLDLNLGAVDGLDVLEWMKRDERLKKVIVFVLTSSKAQRDILESYKLGISGYILRPYEFPLLFLKIESAVKAVRSYELATKLESYP